MTEFLKNAGQPGELVRHDPKNTRMKPQIALMELTRLLRVARGPESCGDELKIIGFEATGLVIGKKEKSQI